MEQKSLFLLKNKHILEKMMIKAIITDYFDFRNFFKENNKDFRQDQFGLKDYIQKKTSFTDEKVSKFYFNYKEHPDLNLMPSGKQLSIPVKNGVFIYPKSFLRYMDRIKDINTNPIREIDLTLLDEFMITFPTKTNFSLDFFLIRFFEVVKCLNISLRPREVELLKLFTNVNFLRKKNDGTDRFFHPSQKEILKIFGLKKNNRLQILRADNLLYNYRICFPHLVIMNHAKHGFHYTTFDIKKKNSGELEKLKQFIFWKFEFQDEITVVACIPFGNIEDLLESFNYSPLLNWRWKINLKHFNPIKYDISTAWNRFIVPTLSSQTILSDEGINWDIRPEFNHFSENETEVIKKLTTTTLINLRSYGNLTDKISPSGLRKIAQRLMKKDLFQLYPGINHINLQNIIGLKFESENNDLLKNISNNLLLFPISHIFSNLELGKVISYIHIPKEFITDLLFRLNDLKTTFPEVKVEMKPLLNPYYVSRCLRLYDINFIIENGIPYLRKFEL